MVYKMYLTLVKAIRLRYAIPFVVLLIILYWAGIRPWMANWGSTAAEQRMALTGDDLIQGSAGFDTKALTINAPPEVIWKWLAQVGQDRAGFYTYTWLENIFATNIHNADVIHPEWQQLAAGGAWRLVSPDYLWGLGKEAADPVLLSEPIHALVLRMFGVHVILPIDPLSSRLILRGPTSSSNLVLAMIVEPLVFTLEKRMLLGLKARAEGHPEVPAALMVFTVAGWATAGITVAGLFLSQRRRRFWLALPVAAALPALLTSSDLQAGLAAFLAVGISLIGFLIFGRNWWGPMMVIGALVLLTLLLAPDAYVVFGLAFDLLLLVALGMILAERTRSLSSAGRRLVSPTQ